MASNPCPELRWVGVSVKRSGGKRKEREREGMKDPGYCSRPPNIRTPFLCLGVLVSGKIATVKVKNSDNLILSHPFSSNRRETQAPPVCTNAPSLTWALGMQSSRSAQGPFCGRMDALWSRGSNVTILPVLSRVWPQSCQEL